MCGSLEVGVGEHDGGCLSAQLERHLGDVAGCSLHDALACPHATGDADDADLRACSQCVAHHRTFSGDDIEDASGQSGFINHLGELATVLWRELRRFDDDGTSRDECSACLSCDEEEWEVPWQNSCYHTYWLLEEHDVLAPSVAGDDFALDGACEGSHIVEVVGGDSHLYGSPCACLSLFTHDDVDKLVLSFPDAVGHFLQVCRPLDGRCLCPAFLCSLGCVECLVHLFHGAFWLSADYFFGRWIEHINPFARLTFNEFSVDVHFKVFHKFDCFS